MAEQLANRRPAPRRSIDAINGTIRKRPGCVLLARHSGHFEEKTRLDLREPDQLIVPTARSTSDLLCHGEPALVKRCANPACHAFFYDTSKDQTRGWCDPNPLRQPNEGHRALSAQPRGGLPSACRFGGVRADQASMEFQISAAKDRSAVCLAGLLSNPEQATIAKAKHAGRVLLLRHEQLMSTYVLMRILESAPRRYDLGIRLLTFGSAGRAYDRLVARVEAGQRVLDIGCGTGALAMRAARRGARVKGIDVNAQMLEIARQRASASGLAGNVDLQEMGIAELDGEQPGSYDVVMSGLCFSELSDDEVAYGLRQIVRVLRPGGLLLLADEVKPPDLARRLLHALIKAPFAALTYLVSQQTTHAVEDLPGKVSKAGFSIESLRQNPLGSFVEIVARKCEQGK